MNQDLSGFRFVVSVNHLLLVCVISYKTVNQLKRNVFYS